MAGRLRSACILVFVPASSCAFWLVLLLMLCGLGPAALQLAPAMFVLASLYCACVVLPSSLLLQPRGVAGWAAAGVVHASLGLLWGLLSIGEAWTEGSNRAWIDAVFLVLVLAVPVGAAAGMACRKALER